MLMSSCENSTDKAEELKLDNQVANYNLFASITINDSIVDSEKDLVVSVSLLNSTLNNHELTEDQVLKNAILSLTIISANGDTLLTGPPVTPKNDSISCYKRVLKPNEKYEFEYVGLNSFDPPLQEGRYKIVMSSFASNTIIFEIK